MCVDNAQTLNGLNTNPAKNPDTPVTDMLSAGTQKMVDLLLSELHYDTPSRYRWGMMNETNNLDANSDVDEEYEEPEC